MNSERDAADEGPGREPVHEEEIDDVPELEQHGQGTGGSSGRLFSKEEDVDLATNPWAATTNGSALNIDPVKSQDDIEFGDYESPGRQLDEAETPDDSVSVQTSQGPTSPHRNKSPLGSPAPSVIQRPRLNSPRHSSLLPFDRRFQARRSLSGTSSLLSAHHDASDSRPGHLTPHSRTSSISTQAFRQDRDQQTEGPEAPWDVIRWSRLGKLKLEVFSEAGKRKFGKITCMAVTSSVALGTSRGILLVFDAKQQLKAIIGGGTKAVESGSVTSIAVSADHSTLAAGHASGAIFTWEIARPAKPFLQIPPASLSELKGTTKDGHVSGVAVLHLGFLGVRHTALVSADDKGMAFSHLATRGMGTLGRAVKTTRILGRYPDTGATTSKPRKPSSVLAFSPLPMGTAEHETDSLGLVAMLTPYLLVIVSTTPVAQTQHKVFRPKNVAPHSAMSGCIAWYPAMQVEGPNGQNAQSTPPKLAYCWSNVLTILEVSGIQSEDHDRDGPSELLFAEQETWRSEEPIVAVQWLSRNILAVLTVSQQLIVLEHPPLHPTDSSDLLRKHIYHVDMFSSHLGHMVEKLDDENTSMHGVVADAFYMSFKSYKGRLFLLGFEDVAIGTLSNWADRLLATMEHGDYIGAIRLASTYYAGNADIASIGLPLSVSERQHVVGDKLLELVSASLRYAFGRNPDAVDRRASEAQLNELATCSFQACRSLSNYDFLFEEVFSSFSQEDHEGIFLDKLQEQILAGEIQFVPPVVLKALVNNFADRDLHGPLEELLCHLIPTTMDLDQVTKLCKSHELFDALFYVWSQAINDYSTILNDLLDAIDMEQISDPDDATNKIFTYLSYTLTGRIYPTGQSMTESDAVRAKAEMYACLFSGSRASADGSRTKLHSLRQLLLLDAAAFMSMLNEAFEDSFLNGPEERLADEELGHISDELKFGLSLNRQYILTILHDFMTIPPFESGDVLFLDMFIARSLPKYPQYIMLPGHVMHRCLTELCEFATVETADDCQLSAEYLLSIYHPPDLSALIPIFLEARFYRVIKTIYRSEGEYDRLLETCLQDTENPGGIYECISDCLRPGAPLTPEQKTDLRTTVESLLAAIVRIDVQKAAITINAHFPQLHPRAIETLSDDNHARYLYLRAVVEPSAQEVATGRTAKETKSELIEQYIQLLCEFDPRHVRPFIETLSQGDLQLEAVLPALESNGMIDSAVVIMARAGQFRDGIDRLKEHLRKLSHALQSLLERAGEAPDEANITETANDLLSSIDKYTNVGVWLCQRYGKSGSATLSQSATVASETKGKGTKHQSKSRYSISDALQPVEALWLELLDAIVTVSRQTGESLSTLSSNQDQSRFLLDTSMINENLRGTVQTAFTALLRATTSDAPSPRFLPILRAFLNRASKSSPSLTHLRQVLSAVFSAYAFEEDILGLATKLLDRDLFVGVEEVSERRRRGWRPLGLACGGCGKKLWGPGAGKEIWHEWFKAHQSHQATKGISRHTGADSSTMVDQGSGKDKAKGKGRALEPTEPQATDELDKGEADAVVVFACRHLFHRKCLHNLLGSKRIDDASLSCPLEGASQESNSHDTVET